MNKRRLFGGVLLLVVVVLSIPELFYTSKDPSKSIGTPGKGALERASLLDFYGANYSYFSFVSYFVLDDAYTHSAVKSTLKNTFESLEECCPSIKWNVMEAGRQYGGKTLIHTTHQNGLSVDLMVPKVDSKGQQVRRYDYLGLLHYLLEFDDNGQLSLDKSTQIDFESLAKLVFELNEAALINGLRVKKVILKLELKDDFFATPSGEKVRQKGIYFARRLGDFTNRMHDDHIHVDFEVVE